MITPYSLHNQDFSDKAHLLAQTEVYPDFFGVARDRLEFSVLPEHERNYLDWSQGIDRVVQVKGYKGNIPLTFQERFRAKKFAKHHDATITTWNHISNMQGELYKLRAQYFLYGYFDIETGRFAEVVIFNVATFLRSHIRQTMHYTKDFNARSQQTFMSVKFEHLAAIGALDYHRKWGTSPYREQKAE